MNNTKTFISRIKKHQNGSYYILVPKNFVDFGEIKPGRKKVIIEDLPDE